MEGMTVKVNGLVTSLPIDHVPHLLGQLDAPLAEGSGGYYLGLGATVAQVMEQLVHWLKGWQLKTRPLLVCRHVLGQNTESPFVCELVCEWVNVKHFGEP